MSIKCKDAFSHEVSWHIGMAKDISVEGMTIEVSALPMIEASSKVKILCFPKEEILASHIPEPEPVRMEGLVIWQDRDKNLLGLKILS